MAASAAWGLGLFELSCQVRRQTVLLLVTRKDVLVPSAATHHHGQSVGLLIAAGGPRRAWFHPLAVPRAHLGKKRAGEMGVKPVLELVLALGPQQLRGVEGARSKVAFVVFQVAGHDLLPLEARSDPVGSLIRLRNAQRRWCRKQPCALGQPRIVLRTSRKPG